MDMTPTKDCERRSDHVFDTDTRGVDRCVFCARTWAETVRGFGLAGDLPGRHGKWADLNRRYNAEAGLA